MTQGSGTDSGAEALRICSGLALEGGLAALEPLYRRVFPGTRAEGWFARKLKRQRAEARCTALAHRGERCTASTVVGFALAGAPPSRAGWWRTSGIGLDAPFRRQGYGQQLVAAMLDLSAAAGAAGVETLAPAWLRGFYGRLGYTHEARDVHLVAPGLALPDAQLPTAGRDPDDPLPPDAHRAWTLEAWSDTPASERRRIALPGGEVGLSREQAGWLVQWWSPADSCASLAMQLQKIVGRDTQLILLGVPEAAQTAQAALLANGWSILERREHHRWRAPQARGQVD